MLNDNLMRIASWIGMMVLGLGIWSCSDADLITPTQVVLEQPLGTFPLEWMLDYQDGQTYVFADGQGQEQAWEVFRGPLSWQSCSSSLTGDTLYICERQYLELANPAFAGRVQFLGIDSTLFIDPDGQQADDFDTGLSVFAAVEGGSDYLVQYGAVGPLAPAYDWTYRYGPAYPSIGSDSLFLTRNAEGTDSQFTQLLFVQGEGWVFYRDTTGVEWVLDRVEG
jgi:hypothetical protein